MPNPDYLLCDTDALIQVFIARQNRLLAHIQDVYGVTAAIVPEVETEVSLHRKFGARFEDPLVRQIEQGRVIVLDSVEIKRLLGARGRTDPQLEQDAKNLIARSQRYRRRVNLGEAYSHAVAVEMQLPLMSHDWEAVKILVAAREPVAIPVLGLWDLFALAFDDGAVDEAEGERAVEHLEHEGEFIPRGLKKSAGPFPDRIARFDSRLRRAVPGGNPAGPQGPRDRLYLRPLG